MLTTGITASTRMGTVFTNTAMTSTDVPPLLAGLLVVSHLKCSTCAHLNCKENK